VTCLAHAGITCSTGALGGFADRAELLSRPYFFRIDMGVRQPVLARSGSVRHGEFSTAALRMGGHTRTGLLKDPLAHSVQQIFSHSV
jgi:hypothetical protein